MYYYFVIFFTCLHLISYSQSKYLASFSSKEIELANTAHNENYLTENEKNIFLILNLVRINPKVFCEAILKSYRPPEGYALDFLEDDRYFLSLINELLVLTPMNPVLPDKLLWKSAKCHAEDSGKRGYVGHARRGCFLPDLYSECCSYGFDSAIDIVLQLLIDYEVPNLGHRKILLDFNQKFLGVSVMPHNTYLYNAVLDLSSVGQR